MVQDQLVDYITAQTKLGTSREAMKTTLLGVGWQAVDIDDSFKKIESAAAKPMSGSPAMASPIKPAATSGPQVIRMSDLVSSPSGQVEKVSGLPAKSDPSSVAKMSAITKNAKMTDTTFEATPAVRGKSKKALIPYIVFGVVIVGLAGFAAYLYVQNSSLSAQVGSVSGQSANVTAQVSSLTAQVNSLTASSAALVASTTQLTAAKQELATELSFYAVPAGVTPTSSAISVTGSLGVNAGKSYFVTALYGGKIFVANSKDAKVAAVLQPLVGSSTQLSGTFIPGSDVMTVTSVNGTTL